MRADDERSLLLECMHELLRCGALVLVDEDYRDLRRCVVHPAKDYGKDGEEGDGQHKGKRQRSAITAQRSDSGTDDGQDHSRSSLPVRCKKTDSRLGRRSETSSRSRPSFAADSSRAPISIERSIENSATPSTMRPPCRWTQSTMRASDPPRRAVTWLRAANALCTSSSLVPSAMIWP